MQAKFSSRRKVTARVSLGVGHIHEGDNGVKALEAKHSRAGRRESDDLRLRGSVTRAIDMNQ